MPKPIRVLIVEDSEDETLVLVSALRRGGLTPEFERVETAASLEAALDVHQWDAIISDCAVPGLGSLDALGLCQRHGLDLPFISVSAAAGEERAAEMLKAGAHDFIRKDNLARLAPVLEREVHAAEERRGRRERESALRHLAAIVESCDDAIIGETLDGIVTSWNAAAERLHGYTAAEMIGRSIFTLIPPYRPQELPEIYERIKRGERVARFETVRIRKDGTPVEVSLTISPVRDAEGRIVGASTVARDITERKLEETERLNLIQDLTAALARARSLRPPIPICPSCRKVLNDQGRWQPLEAYLEEHAHDDFAHGLCPECAVQLIATAA